MRRPERGGDLQALHRRGGGGRVRGRGRGHGRGRGAVVEPVRIDLDVDEREVGRGERVEEVIDEREVERVTVQLEDLERARGARREERDQRRPRGGSEAEHGQAKLAQVRRAEVDEEGREEGVAQLGVAREI
jgi:hypothetical protein